MLHPGFNCDFSETMDLFKEIDDLSDLFFSEKNSKVDSIIEENELAEDLQSKYSNLHENYAREIENSKKVEKCLIKCLKFYSKLCKKYEVQQKLIRNLEENVKEKISRLEEAHKNEERMKGLIQVYKTERTLYAGQTCSQLRKDKELLLDICCKLVNESVKNSTSRNLTQLILRKFKKDLDDEKINLLRGKNIKLKDELGISGFEILKSDLIDLKKETEFKPEDKVNSFLAKVENKEPEDLKNNSCDLSFSYTIAEESGCLDNKHSSRVSDKEVFVETEQISTGGVSSLPSLEEIPFALEAIGKECQNESSVDESVNREEFDSNSSGHREKSDIIGTHLESINGSSARALPTSKEKEPDHPVVYSALESPNRQKGKSGSIFEVSDCRLTVSNFKVDFKEQENNAMESEDFSEISFEAEDKSDDRKVYRTNPELINSEKGSTSLDDKELFKIFREMSSVRLLSPIRECINRPTGNKTSAITLNVEEVEEYEKSKSDLKRNLDKDGNSSKIKRLKTDSEKLSCNLLDSIMSAMSMQNEEFRAKGISAKEVEDNAETSCESATPFRKAFTRSVSSKENFLSIRQSPRQKEANLRTAEKLVMNEIRNFVLSSISSKEEADKNVKHCLSVLSNKSEDVIAKCIVAIIFENVDEAVEIYERPSPPLTKTQHRLIVLLSVLRTLDSKYQNISNKILSMISDKLLPDNFFWPDDCVESAARFYAALCRTRNDPKTLWRFCLQGMTDMRQRCPLLMLTVLKTWPDVLHDASTLKNNILAVTIVNIYLNMPKKEGLRNFNQGRKLVALKHLLINFYQFKVEDTIEGYAKKVLDSVFKEEAGSEKSIVLLSKCKDRSWTVKNILPILKSKLVEWFEGSIKDSVASRVLSVIKQISPALQEDGVNGKLKDIGLYLSEILTSSKKNHDSEVSIIEVLLQLKQYPEVRKVIREWIPKNPIDDGLRNEIINASAENILRELKVNRKREQKPLSIKKKFKKQPKKSKKKKLKGKNIKRVKYKE